MNYHNITKDDFLNGDGIRVVLWVAGCTHHCPECHNPETWDFHSGIPFGKDALEELRVELSKDYVAGITLSGGDPLVPRNRETTLALVEWTRKHFPTKTIWVYTGYSYEQLVFEGSYVSCCILKNIDVLVDGNYKKDLRDVNLKWRGSSNQRVINMKETLKTGRVVHYCE